MGFAPGDAVAFVAPGGLIVPATVLSVETTDTGPTYDVIYQEPVAIQRLGSVFCRLWTGAVEDEETPGVGTCHTWANNAAVSAALEATIKASLAESAKRRTAAGGTVAPEAAPDLGELLRQIASLRAEMRAMTAAQSAAAQTLSSAAAGEVPAGATG